MVAHIYHTISTQLKILFLFTKTLKHNENFNNSGIRWTMSTFLQHLDYADDIYRYICDNSVLDVAEMLYSIVKAASSAGLNINASKTESMHIVHSRATSPINSIFLDRSPVETVEQSTYPGSEICMDGGSDADMECRINKA